MVPKCGSVNSSGSFNGNIPLLYEKAIKDQIKYNKSKSKVFEHFLPKAGESFIAVSDHPLS